MNIDNKLKKVFRIVMIFFITYFSVSLLVYFFGERLIFFPPNPPSYSDNETILQIDIPKGQKITATYYKNPKSEYTIIYCHGNAEDIGVFTFYVLNKLYKLNFSFFSFDYTGYGIISGKPSEKNTYQDAQAAYEYVVKQLNIPPEKIIIYGHSLGAAVAIDLATQKEVAGVILEAPFISAFRVITQFPLFPFDRYRNISKISKINCPVLVLHGKKDDVVPFWHGQKIFEKANDPKLFLWVDDADHINLASAAGKKYDNIINEFVSLLNSSKK